MTKEEAIKYLRQIYPNGGHCWLDNQRIEALRMAVDALSQLSLPAGLEEAAEEYARPCGFAVGTIKEETTLPPNPDKLYAFKAGAKWRDAQTPKLPDNLEEAATVSMPKPNGIESNTDFSFFQMVGMFEQGAKWMAGQGVSKECLIGMVTNEIICNITEKTLNELGCCPNDKVIVQIRKK